MEKDEFDFLDEDLDNYVVDNEFLGDDIFTEDEQAIEEKIVEEKINKPEKSKEKKRKKWFNFKKKDEVVFEENQKPIDSQENLAKAFEHTGEIDIKSGAYKDLFEENSNNIEQTQTFEKIQRERRKRVKDEAKMSGTNLEEIDEEFGIVAPIPVTSQEFGTMDLFDFQQDFQNLKKPVVEEIVEDEIVEEEIIEDEVVEDEIIEDEIVEDEIVEEEIVEDEIVEEEIVEDEVIEDEVVEEEILEYEVVEEEPTMDLTKEIEAIEDNEAILSQLQNQEEKPEEETTEALENVEQAQDEIEEKAVEQTQEEVQEEDKEEIVEEIPVAVPVGLQEKLEEEIVDEPQEETSEEPKEKVKKVKKQKVKEKVEPQPQEEVKPELEIEGDYIRKEEANDILRSLNKGIKETTMRAMVAGVLSVVMLIINAIGANQFAQKNYESADFFAGVGLVAVAICVGMCIKPFSFGLKNLVKYKTNADSFVAIATVAVIIQSVYLLINKEAFTAGVTHIYAVIVVIAWALNSIGKLIIIKRVRANFRYVISREDKYTIKIFDDYNVSLELTKDCVTEKPVIAYQKKTNFLKRFLQISNENDPSEKIAKGLAPICLVTAIVLYIVVVIKEGDMYTAITMFTAAMCVSMPICNIISVHMPFSAMCNKMRRTGALMANYSAISEVAKVNSIMVDASDIFTPGSVHIKEMKDFGSKYAIPSVHFAAALLKEVGGTYADIGAYLMFEDEPEYTVDEYAIKPKFGVSGIVKGKKVAVGTYKFLQQENVYMPSSDEINELKQMKDLMFIAFESELVACMKIDYRAEKRKINDFAKLEECGVSVVVRSLDPLVTKELIVEKLKVSPSTIAVVDSKMCEVYEELIQEPEERSNALISTKGRIESLISLITTCHSNQKLLSLIMTIQTISVVMGIVIVIIMSLCGGITQMSAGAILIYLLFWSAVSLLVSKFKKI